MDFSEIVITGASGFVGKALVSKLKSLNISHIPISRQKIEGYLTIDDYANIAGSDNAVLIHLAQDRNASNTNYPESVELCETLFSKSWKHIIYISSVCVYGDLSASSHFPDEVCLPFDYYAENKLACEKIALKYHSTILRLSNIYGPGMASDNVISDILNQLYDTKPLVLRNVLPVRDFVWIDDVVNAIINSCIEQVSGIFNIGTGQSVSVGRVANIALNLIGNIDRKIDSNAVSSKHSVIILDISDTKKKLHWLPKVNLEQGLRILIFDNNE